MSGVKKILMLAYEDVLKPTGGLGVHVNAVCEKLSENNIEVVVVCFEIENQRGGFFVDGEEVNRENWKGNYRVLKVFGRNQILSHSAEIHPYTDYKMFMDNILAFLKDENFDLIHIHDSPLWNVADSLKIFYQCPIVYTCHLAHKFVHLRMTNELYRWGIQNEGNALHGSDVVIAVSKNYKERLKKEYGVFSKVIYNGVNYKELENTFMKQVKNRIGFVGRMVNSKGVDLVLDAVKHFQDKYFIVISNIAETLENIDTLYKKIKKYEKKYKNFEWHNGIEKRKKHKLMKSCEFAIMPSIHEPFGIVALEWMSLGIPLIVSRVGGLKEFCTDKNSVGIEPTKKDLIKAIKNFKRDENKINEGYKTALNMNWKKTVLEIMRVYDDTRSINSINCA